MAESEVEEEGLNTKSFKCKCGMNVKIESDRPKDILKDKRCSQCRKNEIS